MLARERTNEVLIVSCDMYRISLFFQGTVRDRDTVVIEAPSLWGDETVSVFMLANSQEGGNLIKFSTYYTKRQIEIVLWLLERHQNDIYEALTK